MATYFVRLKHETKTVVTTVEFILLNCMTDPDDPGFLPAIRRESSETYGLEQEKIQIVSLSLLKA